mgnify:CR=1 FL=1
MGECEGYEECVCRRNGGEGVAVLDATCYNSWNPQGCSGSVFRYVDALIGLR